MSRISDPARLPVILLTVGLVFGCEPADRAPEQAAMEADELSIEGTYELVSRELPDGTVKEPPEIFGLLTYTGTHRNFHVYWEDVEGNRFSIAYVATYSLTDSTYSETSHYYMENNEIDGEGVTYDLSGPSGSSPVTVSGERISFDLPLYGEPHVVFHGDSLMAIREGAFVDHWVEVK